MKLCRPSAGKLNSTRTVTRFAWLPKTTTDDKYTLWLENYDSSEVLRVKSTYDWAGLPYDYVVWEVEEITARWSLGA